MLDDFSNLTKDFFSAVSPKEKDMPLAEMLETYKQSQKPTISGSFFKGPLHGQDYIVEGRIREWMRREEIEKRETRERSGKKPPQP